ncbi:MAG: phosphate signaling complex protein PhoU [Melioribacteraceae bacterium]|nr:phosphate signaling complex protein PhoU [Melioribacteraceae bacterium]
MKTDLNTEIESLKTNLIKMASIVDEQVERVIYALETGEVDHCKGVRARDLEVDAYDNLIQTQCENLLTLFQPIDANLRFILSTLIINNQLERCGDIAINVAQRLKKAEAHNELILEARIYEMGQNARKMLKQSIDSFIYQDSDLAMLVIQSDDKVDQLNKETFKFLVKKMETDVKLIEPCAHLLILTRNLERLADHATNIAENLLFFVDGKIISHRKKLENPPKERDNPKS